MELKYLLLILGIVSVTKLNAHQIEFQNIQVVDYDEKNASYFGKVDMDGFQKIGKKYYWIQSTTKVKWWDAHFACLDLNSSLATIETFEELEYLTPHLLELNNQNYYWVDGTDKHKEGDFRWVGTGKVIPRGDLWSNTQPDNAGGNEDCVHLWWAGQKNMFRLNDYLCSHTIYFICERKAPNVVSFVAK